MYKVGIIGAGMIAAGYDDPNSENILTHAHAVGINNKTELIGFFDVNKEKSNAAANKWKALVFESIHDLVKECDIVCCATPDQLHYDTLKAILLSPEELRAIICEKPIATNLMQATQIIRDYSSLGIPVVVNYTRRFLGGFGTLKDIVGNLGKFILGNCYYGKGLLHNGSHMVNLVDYIIGITGYKKLCTIEQVNDFYEKDPSIAFFLEFGDDARLFFHVIPNTITSVFQFELFFEKGKLLYDSTLEQVKVYEVKEWEKYPGYTHYKEIGIIKTDRSEAMVNLYEDVINVISNGSKSKSDGESAVETLRICDAVRTNVKEG